jgi:pimeloyl-ACP methyl ester carboxylesterase
MVNEVHSMQCKLANITIDYEVHGEGRPLLAIHGFPLDRRVMIGCIEPLFVQRSGWKRIYLDLPGMGKTEGPDWIDSSDQVLDVVLEFIDAVIPRQHLALVGESYGGYIAMGVTHRRRSAIDGLALICPMTIAETRKRALPQKEVLVENVPLLLSLTPEDRTDFESITIIQSSETWQRFREEILSGLRAANKSFVERLWTHAYGFSFDIGKAAGVFRAPTLIIAGRQDSAVGYRDTWSIMENYPRGTFAVLDRAGHDLQIEQERLFNALVNEWLDRVEEPAAQSFSASLAEV